MAFTNDEWLPTYEDLKVPEIDLSSAPLRAGAHQFGKYCDNQCKEFMLCYAEEKDPRKCLKEGKEVTRCGVEFFQKIKSHCADQFTQYWQCVDGSGHDMSLSKCRTTQAAFDKCVFDNLGQERPELGYFSKVRVHHTTRPKPSKEIWLPEPLPDPPKYEAGKQVPESTKQGLRGIL